MLETRNHGYSFAQHCRKSAKLYLILIAYLGVSLALLSFWHFWSPFYFVFGMVVGAFLRDVGWVRSIVKTRPFTEKVVDWDKVQRLADANPSSCTERS